MDQAWNDRRKVVSDLIKLAKSLTADKIRIVVEIEGEADPGGDGPYTASIRSEYFKAKETAPTGYEALEKLAKRMKQAGFLE